MERGLPAVLAPLLAEVARDLRKPELPPDFWTIAHGPTILDAFQSLAALLMLSDIAENEIPKGYVMLTYLFDWETQCQFDGWGAFANIRKHEFERILGFFSDVGLSAEADSLRTQMDAYLLNPEDIEALNRAAERSRHPLSSDLDRLEYLTQYFCDNADALLYE